MAALGFPVPYLQTLEEQKYDLHATLMFSPLEY